MSSVKKGIIYAAFIVVLVTAFTFGVIASSAQLTGSNFEIDPDANLIVNTAGNDDWASVSEARKADMASGALDNSFKSTKEDTAVPILDAGGIPPNKSDLLTFGVNSTQNAAGTQYMQLFWRRVQDPNGTTNMDFEFNKSKVLSANGVTPVRSDGDALIQYDLSRGGTVPTLFLSRWVTSGAGSQCEANNAVPCWNKKVNMTAAGVAIGSINSSPISAANSDGLGAMSARTFGEAEINLSALQGSGGGPSCSVFGSAYLKSRSSDSFTSELKDFIAPEAIDLDQCANVIIRKVTDPASDPASVQFGYTKSINTSPVSANTFTLGDGQNKSYDNVLLGNGYTVNEDVIPAGWDFDSLDCSASSGVTPVIAGAQVSFDIDSKDDILDCTYHNKARANLHVVKITDDGSGSFPFSSNTLTPASFNLVTSAAGDAGKASQDFLNLVPGGYDVAESVPAGWHLVSSSCDNGNDPASITLAGGDNVTCTFHDARDQGAILIAKLRKHAADGPGDHPQEGVTFTVTGGELASPVVVATNANGVACVTGLVLSSFAGQYHVEETIPAGYHNVGGTIQNVNVTAASASCDVAVDSPAQVTFHNMPLTDIDITVNSQVDGGTSSHINCDGVEADTNANGDGHVLRSDLEPGTYTCTVVVDP